MLEGDELVELISINKAHLDQLMVTVADHEKRLRAIEKIVAGIMAIGALCTVFIRYLKG